MSMLKIRKALETALASMSPALATAWENAVYSPSPTVPYQRAQIDFAQPLNNEFGRVYQERGYMQLALAYPQGTGAAAATTRAEMIRSVFYRGATFTDDGQVVTVNLTPQILPGYVDDAGRYILTVRVPFFAQVAS